MKKLLLLSLFLSSNIFAASTDTFIDYTDYIPAANQTRTYKVTCISKLNSLENCTDYTKVIETETPSTTQISLNRTYYNINNEILYKENLIYGKANKILKLQSITTLPLNTMTTTSKTTYSNNSYLKSFTLLANKQSDYYLTNPLSSWNDEYTYTFVAGSEKNVNGNIVDNRIDYLKSLSVSNINYNNVLKRERSFVGGGKNIEWLAPKIGVVKRFLPNTTYTLLWELTGVK
jgi:hypothetical protein